ncbi:hypothetical protein, partial [Moritella viscosa]|uniref:hypothetical protein n=1 Tax=Moritella viscosa TaxID=80854 RepID=UPI001C4A686A
RAVYIQLNIKPRKTMTFNCSLETFVTRPLSFFAASKMFQAGYNVILNYSQPIGVNINGHSRIHI